ncbi:MAG TPA: glycosyltransferase [Longimicrobiales bacterium]
MRVAIVHDWLTGMRGGERVLEALLDLWPDAEIFTLLHVPGSVSRKIESRPIHASFIGRLPGAARHYRRCLPLFPFAVERLDLRGFDFIVSSSHCVAKSARPPLGVPHLCYCHTPMRYAWDLFPDYFGAGRAALPVRLAMAALAPWLRRWDAATARRVTAFVASSRHVRSRIRRCYGRDAAVVHPPVDIDRFRPAERRDDFYLMVNALVPYKRVDLAVEAFNALGRPLVIVGKGPGLERLRRMAGPNIRFTGWLPDDEVADLLARCRAFIHPANEDFGIAAVEAQAAGAPVIAFRAGGAMETVIGPTAEEAQAYAGGSIPGATGLFFTTQTADALAAAVRAADRLSFEPATLRANARRFDVRSFHRGIRRCARRLLAAGRDGEPAPRRGRASGDAAPPTRRTAHGMRGRGRR